MSNTQIAKGHIASLAHPGVATEPLPKIEAQNPPHDGNTLFVFRHGQTEDNINRIFSGRRETHLTNEGVKQCGQLAKKLKGKPIDVGIYSNNVRARDTLEIALKYHPNVKKETTDTLLERDYGDLTGKSKIELNKQDPELCQKYRRSWDFPPPNGESLKMVWDNRLKQFCKDLEKRIKRDKINVAVSCTGNTMRLIRMYFEGLSVEEMLAIESPTAQDYVAYLIG